MSKSQAYFFDSNFKQDLEWKEGLKIRVGSVHPNNKDQISKSLKDLSHESIRNRFLGTKKEFSPTELEYLTNVDGTNHYAIGIEEREKPFRGIAVVRLVRSVLDETQAEIAVTIIDNYQGMGLGTMLMRMIALAAAERSITKLSFTFLPQNQGIIRLIKKLGPATKASAAMDYVQYSVDLGEANLKEIKSLLVPFLPSIDTFHLKT